MAWQSEPPPSASKRLGARAWPHQPLGGSCHFFTKHCYYALWSIPKWFSSSRFSEGQLSVLQVLILDVFPTIIRQGTRTKPKEPDYILTAWPLCAKMTLDAGLPRARADCVSLAFRHIDLDLRRMYSVHQTSNGRYYCSSPVKALGRHQSASGVVGLLPCYPVRPHPSPHYEDQHSFVVREVIVHCNSSHLLGLILMVSRYNYSVCAFTEALKMTL